MAHVSEKESRADAREVESLRLQGLSIPKIAQYLGISTRAVSKRLAKARKLNREYAGAIDQQEKMGEALARLEKMERLALSDYFLAEPATSVRAGFLNAALAARRQINDFLMATGIIEKIKEYTPFDELTEALNNEEFLLEYTALLKKARLLLISQKKKSHLKLIK